MGIATEAYGIDGECIGSQPHLEPGHLVSRGGVDSCCNLLGVFVPFFCSWLLWCSLGLQRGSHHRDVIDIDLYTFLFSRLSLAVWEGRRLLDVSVGQKFASSTKGWATGVASTCVRTHSVMVS